DLTADRRDIAGYAQWIAPELPAGATAATVRAALQAVVAAHPALRLRLSGAATLTVDETAPPLEVGEGAGTVEDVAADLAAELDPA
ncbi:hypothetical protein PJM50_30030, partial [Mycobacterium kansasii]